MIRARAVIVAASLALTLAAGASAAPAVNPDSPGCVVAPAPRIGLTRTSSRAVDARIADLTLHSVAMAGDQHVDVMVPRGYDPSGATRYPVLYLLHGSFGTYTDWVTNGVETLAGDLRAIVVMPDDGIDGSYSDWYGTVAGSTGHAPGWESYHVRELIPFIDAHYPTRATRGGRFIAGLSSGGAGAAKYAAANPGLFGAVGSFSGAVDTDIDYPQYPLISEALWGITAIPGEGPDGHCTWGDPFTQHVVWLDNDPTYLAQNFEGTPLYLAAGDGNPGALDAAGANFDPVEYEVHAMTLQLIKALDAAGLPHTDDLYGAGTHTWPYWKRDLTRFLAWLAPYLRKPSPVPEAFSVRSARRAFSAWDWRLTPRRDVREFTYLADVSKGGLGVTGSGGLGVVTAPLYRAGRPYDVTAAGGPRRVVADAVGRLAFTLDLGPSHDTQQSDFGAGATDGWTHVQVRIAPARP
jgi:S-formylglutathione hydrolase FrmB